MMIPRVIYQTWKTKDRNAWTRSTRRWVGSWEKKNPGFEHRLFDDADWFSRVGRRFQFLRSLVR